MTEKNPNAKDPRFETPIDLSGVKPSDYDKRIESGRGSAIKEQPGQDEGAHYRRPATSSVARLVKE